MYTLSKVSVHEAVVLTHVLVYNSGIMHYFFLLQEVEYAIEVVLSDESRYTIFRTLKEVATFNVSLSCYRVF